jgi:hypothetical protein
MVQVTGWRSRKRVTLHWLRRVRIGQLALEIASRDLVDAEVTVRLSSVHALVTNEMELNEANTMVQMIRWRSVQQRFDHTVKGQESETCALGSDLRWIGHVLAPM